MARDRLLDLVLWTFAVLTLLGWGILYLGSGRTEELFAWTINPPITAAFLGGGYGAGCVLVVLARREDDWHTARMPFITIFVFVLVTLAATVMHLANFHFDRGGVAGVAAWFWLAVYVVVPVLMAIVLFQHRVWPSPPRTRDLPGPLAVLVGVEGGIMFVVGLVLFAEPDAEAVLWGWQLTPLTARAVAAWLLALGTAAAMVLVRRDLAALAASAVTYTVFALLQLGAVVRFADQVEWARPAAWAYLAVLVAMLATGAWGWHASRGLAVTGTRPTA